MRRRRPSRRRGVRAPSDVLERGRSVAHPAAGWLAVALFAAAIAHLSLLTEAAVLAAIGVLTAIRSGEFLRVLSAVPVLLALSVVFPGVIFLPVATLVSALGIVIARSSYGDRVPRRMARGIAALCGASFGMMSLGWPPRAFEAVGAFQLAVTAVVGAMAGLASFAVGRWLASRDLDQVRLA